MQATKPLRTWNRLRDARGGVLAGGIAYFGFFSLVPALIVGFTAFGVLLGGDASLQRQVAQRVNDSVGFVLIGTDPGTGVVQLSELVQGEVLTLAGAFGLIVLVFAGLGWVQATRQGIRAVFGVPPMTNPVLARLRDAATLGLLGVAVLVSLGAGLAVGTATGALTRLLGWSGTPLAEGAVWLAGSLVLLAVDTLIFLLFFTVLSDLPVPVADLRSGAYLAGAGMQVLKLSGGLLVHRVSHDPLLASSVVIVGFLVWMNLAARLTLLGAAWAAVTAADRGHLDAVASSGSLGPGDGPGDGGGQGEGSGPRRSGPGAGDAAGRGTIGVGGSSPKGRTTEQRREREAVMPSERRASTPTASSTASSTGSGAARVLVGPRRRAAGPARPRTPDGRRPSPYARRAAPMPVTFGQRSGDRVTLLAGFVLGAGALIATRVVVRALGTVREAVRRAGPDA